MHPFTPRPIHFLGLHPHNGWRIKLYSISLASPNVELSEFRSILDRALSALPQPAVTAVRPGVGFCIIHQGRGADYVVLAWWDRENELPLRVFVRPAGESEWRVARESESVCVWDLQVIGFERDAYVDTLLAMSPQTPEDYLERVFNLPVNAA